MYSYIRVALRIAVEHSDEQQRRRYPEAGILHDEGHDQQYIGSRRRRIRRAING
jgi:hypothetical protein